jgi:hypothetical protein
METYPKDERLEGKYVQRCKCGARPHSDRLYARFSWWIACNCGWTGASGSDLEEAIKKWNNNERHKEKYS